MATIIHRSSDQFRVQIRRKGLPSLPKTFTTRRTAQEWARKTESELERNVYLDVSESQSTLFSDYISRYIDEVAINHKGYIKEKSRAKGIKLRLKGLTLSEITPSVLSK